MGRFGAIFRQMFAHGHGALGVKIKGTDASNLVRKDRGLDPEPA